MAWRLPRTPDMSLIRIGVIASLVVGCSRGFVLQEPAPVVVTATPPRPVPHPAPIIRAQLVLRDAIHFDTNRDTIKQESFGVLDDVAHLVKVHPELVKIRIEGHTDAVGNARANLELSKRRAIAVRDYLIQHGVDAARLIAEGYGGDNPIADNETDDGRAKNRRVVFTILDRTDGGVVASTDGGGS